MAEDSITQIPQPSLAPKTTEQEDITHASQRKVNLIWETTQSAIALMTVLACVVVAVSHGLSMQHPEFPPTLANTLFLIIGFYFGRTNHTRVGGVGAKLEADR